MDHFKPYAVPVVKDGKKVLLRIPLVDWLTTANLMLLSLSHLRRSSHPGYISNCGMRE